MAIQTYPRRKTTFQSDADKCTATSTTTTTKELKWGLFSCSCSPRLSCVVLFLSLPTQFDYNPRLLAGDGQVSRYRDPELTGLRVAQAGDVGTFEGGFNYHKS